MRERAGEVDKLRANVEWALDNRLPARELVPMLEKLMGKSVRDSADNLFAKQNLAEVLVETRPWRAALLMREVLAVSDNDRSWAIMGLSHTLLGNYRCAAKAYRRALVLAPECPWYAHNLGHLLDVAFGRPLDGLKWLKMAYRAQPREIELASSYAHALVRCGRRDQARRLLTRALGRAPEVIDALLDEWLARTPPGSSRAASAANGFGVGSAARARA
jgi:tetratricopeptide (TPR) repeat protein